MHSPRIVAAAAVALALLAGCGGGADAPPPPSAPAQVTAAALALVAGDIGSSGNLDGSAGAARFDHPNGIAIDSAGNLYVADTGNDVVRKISAAGVVSTFAGRPGVAGGDDGPAATATFSAPTGVAVDAAGNVYVADWGGSTVRKITPAGTVSTVAGSYGAMGQVDAVGSNARFLHPYGVTVATDGTLFVTDQAIPGVNRGMVSLIRQIDTDGSVQTAQGFEDQGTVPYGIVIRGSNAGFLLYFTIVNFQGTDSSYVPAASQLLEMDDDGFVTVLAGSVLGAGDGAGSEALFDYANGISIDTAGENLYVADTCNATVRRVTATDGGVMTLAGAPPASPSAPAGSIACQPTANSTDGTGALAVFDTPAGTAVDPQGNVFVVDSTSSVVRRITPAGVVTTVAGAAFQTGSQDGPGAAARFSFYRALAAGVSPATAIDATGNVFVADTMNSDIRRIDATGQVGTFAGTPGSSGNADGTGAAASFARPAGLAFDAGGTLYVADQAGNVVRKITAAGVVSTLAGTAGAAGSADGHGAAARFSGPTGLAVDAAGNVYVADTGNDTIRRITPAGDVSTLAGSAGVAGGADGTGLAAGFDSPSGLAIDAAGNLYVADTGNQTIRKIAPGGAVTTLAGARGAAGSMDGAGSAARFDAPGSVAVDAGGNVYVADTANHTVRQVTAAGVTTTLLGVAGQDGVRFGSDPRLDTVSGLSVQGHRLVLVSAGAVLSVAVP